MTDTPAEGEFQIHVRTEGDLGVLEWNGATTEDVLFKAISMAADDVIMGHAIRRVEVQVPIGDMPARHALHRAGFRLEGVRREAYAVGADHVDVCMYARLAGDIAYGRNAFSGVMNSVLPRTRVLAHVLLRDPAENVLLLATTYKDDWELPGGVAERGESPREAAEREVAEELGITVPMRRLLAVDWMPPYLGWDDAVEFIFDGGVLHPEQHFALDETEIRAAHWVDVDRVAAHLTPGALARLKAILAATEAAAPLYLEHGKPGTSAAQ